MENNEQMEQKVETTEEKAEPKAEAKEEPKEEKKYTDKDVDEIINKRFAKWQKEQDRKVEEAKRLEAMNAEEKAKYERDELQKELDALKAEKAHAEMAKTVKDLVYNELKVAPQDGLANILVGSTAEATNEAVKDFIQFFYAYFTLKVGGNEPRRGSTSALTREQIFAIKDPNKRLKAIEENMDLFNQKG